MKQKVLFFIIMIIILMLIISCEGWEWGDCPICPPVPINITLLSPADEETIMTVTPTFEWETDGTASLYHLMIDDDSDFSSPIVDKDDISDTSYTLSGTGGEYLESGITYYWKVRAQDGNGTWWDWSNSDNDDWDFYMLAYWAKSYGGNGEDSASSIFYTANNEIIIGGNTMSFGAGNKDAFLMKQNIVGDIIWQKTFGGSNIDVIYDISYLQTDNCYMVNGSTYSYGSGSGDIWIMKIDTNGNILWQKVYGGTDDDAARGFSLTSDNGFIIGSSQFSYSAGEDDYAVIKLDSNGNIQWQKAFGGTNRDVGTNIKEMNDGNFIIAGNTQSGNHLWILKLNNTGSILWEKTYGGSGSEGMLDYQPMLITNNNDIVIAGHTSSYGAGGYDMWLLKIDENGNIVWEKSIGGGNDDLATTIIELANGNYLISGYTNSFGAGNYDIWILESDSNGNILSQKTYGSTNMDIAFSIYKISNNGFITAGYTYSYGEGISDVWLMKMDNNGYCTPFGVDSNATISITSCEVTDTSCTVTVPTFTVTDINCTVNNINFTVNQQTP